MRILWPFLVVVGLSQAQVVSPVPTPLLPLFPPELKQYLTLSDGQVQQLNGLNAGYTRLTLQKSARTAQVYREIAEETTKPTLDPMALGLRYVELEAIRRELADARKKLQDQSLAVLSDAQKTKLKTLDDARKLQPLISQAECENLLEPAAVQGYAGFLIGVPSGAVASTGSGVLPGNSFSCGSYGFLTPEPVPQP
jgi:hypothetical protein